MFYKVVTTIRELLIAFGSDWRDNERDLFSPVLKRNLNILATV